jgi:hypothetical protein
LRLRHRAVSGGDDEDRAVHLGGTGDHVLHIVSVAGAIDVRIVTRQAVSYSTCAVVDGDAAFALFFRRGLSMLAYVHEGFGAAGFGQNLGDGSGQRRLAMVDVTDGADVAVRLVPLKL